jgi:S-formylglutathione hydrolase FrmB
MRFNKRKDDEMPIRLRNRSSLAILLLLVATTHAPAAEVLRFDLTFAESISNQPFTGRVFVFLSQGSLREPRFGPNWLKPEPFFARDVKDWRPGTAITIDNNALGFPMKLAQLSQGSYIAQAVMDFDRGYREIGNGPGNAYSKSVRFEVMTNGGNGIALSIDRVVPERQFKETDRIKLVDIESKLLTAFHGKPMHLKAGIILPASYAEKPDKRYPVIYDIPGFGGDHHYAMRIAGRKPTDVAGVEMLYVVLDPNCRTGHHVFADSANNGPCGKALVEELIPHIEKTFRGIGRPEARFVTGHSSGGWSSLWLQVAYPDFFGGVWSLSPDPVDFRDFQRINLYKPGENCFHDDAGAERPLGRRDGKPILIFQPFSDMEAVLGRGGQLGSFEAVFSPRGADGRPKKLWDRKSGAIDPEVAKSWEAYDINLVVKRSWKTLGPKLKGKLHIYTGEKDTFYLEGAVRSLKGTLTELGSDAVIEIMPGHDHGSLLTRTLYDRIANEMTATFRRHFPNG